jgi:hypothetical protein
MFLKDRIAQEGDSVTYLFPGCLFVLWFDFFQNKLELWQISTSFMWHVASPTVWPLVTRVSCFRGVQGVMVN